MASALLVTEVELDSFCKLDCFRTHWKILEEVSARMEAVFTMCVLVEAEASAELL